jgi:hypothetical protein
VRLEGLGQSKKIHLIGIRTRDLPVCGIVPQPTTLPRDPDYRNNNNNNNDNNNNNEITSELRVWEENPWIETLNVPLEPLRFLLQSSSYSVGFMVLTAVVMKSSTI